MKTYVSVLSTCVFALFCLVSQDALGWHSLTTNGKCKRTRSTCRTTIGNAGGQGACCDPRSSGLASCANTNACEGGTPYKWPSLPVQWSLNLNNMPGKSGYAGKLGSAIETAVKKAWDAWTKPSCTEFSHKYLGRTSTRTSTSDRKSVLFLATTREWPAMGFPSSVLAVTWPATDGRGTLLDADIIFNPSPSGRIWGMNPNVNRNEMDFADVAAHEIGHALGFGHTAPRSSLMYYAVRGIGPLFNGLTSDEEGGVCTIYPVKKCTTNSQCGGTCHACSHGVCGPKNLSTPSQVCKACKSDANCSSVSCAQIDGRFRCLQPCDAEGCCSSGYTCKSLSGKKLCVPKSNQCPDVNCSTNNDCGTGESCTGNICKKSCQLDTDCRAGLVCKNKSCVPVQPSKLGQPCSQNIPCITGTSCQNTSKGQLCTVSCGSGTGGFPNGSAGSSCSSCSGGTTCINLSFVQACLRPCSRSSDCSHSGGGTCARVNGSRAFCMCQKDSDCGNGYGCNTQASIRSGLAMGGCTKRGGSSCPTGYLCDASFCVPSSGQTCGNGTCDGSEDCSKCPKDCACPSGQNCQGSACVVPSSCGNGSCDNGENCGTCAVDCPCSSNQVCNNNACQALKSVCGDGFCNGSETCDSCQSDCMCPGGLVCQAGACKPLASCGNGKCDEREDCGTCPQDCACPAKTICLDKKCLNITGEPLTKSHESGGTDAGSVQDRGTLGGNEQGSSQGDVTKIAPKPSEVGGSCHADDTCDAGLICVQQLNGSKICLQPQKDTPTFRPQGSGCDSLSDQTLNISLLFLFGLLLVFRQKRA